MDLTALFKFSYGLYVAGVSHDGRLGGCIVDALVQASSDEPPTVILCSIKGNYTNEIIKLEKEFSISVLPATVDPFVVANFGFQSARTADKWKNVPHTVENGLPRLSCAASYVRCKVKNMVELTTHTAFFCEVTEAVNGEGAPLVFGDYQRTMKKDAYAAFEKFKAEGIAPSAAAKWQCSVCGHIYEGGVPFEELPSDWVCPVCGVGKEKFERI